MTMMMMIMSGVQVYTCNYFNNIIGKNKVVHNRHAGVALECQVHPAAANFSHFPSIRLNPGELYHQETTYRFTNDAAVCCH